MTVQLRIYMKKELNATIRIELLSVYVIEFIADKKKRGACYERIGQGQ
jgi:hypothetical protein